MLGLLEMIFRTISFWLDSIVFSFIPTVYNLLINIAETTVFTDDVIQLFADRVYGLLGIFMLFKVSFSILSYIVNPDDFTDKNKGFSKIIQNVLMTLALLVLTPIIFSEAMNLQRIILRDNVLGKLILGTNDSVSSSSATSNPGSSMAYETLKAFYYLDYDLHEECKDFVLGKDPDLSADCKANAFEEENEEFFKILKYSKASKSVSLYLNWSLIYAEDGNGEYSMEYKPIFSTIAGAFMVLILLSFCFDVAVRSIKIGFLRMIAPIPIISRIDPKKGKEMFGKWVKSCISTYMDLFIRLAAIYFAIFVITQILDTQMVNAVTGTTENVDNFVRVFIILGALLFAKQLPKLIEDLLGIKMAGNFQLNPLKKLGEVPLAGKVANTAIGAVDSALHGNGFKAGIKRNWKNVPLTGGDGKKSIFDTADRKMRNEVKEKRDYAKQRYEGKEDLVETRKKYDQGGKSITAQNDLDHTSTMADYQRAGFKSTDYIKASMDVEQGKESVKAQEKDLNLMQSKLAQQQSLIANLKSQFEQAEASGNTAVAASLKARYTAEEQSTNTLSEDVTKAKQSFEKSQKIQSAREANLSIMEKIYVDDAKLEKSRKAYGKADKPNPRP